MTVNAIQTLFAPESPIRLRAIREDFWAEMESEMDTIDPEFDNFEIADLFQFVTGE